MKLFCKFFFQENEKMLHIILKKSLKMLIIDININKIELTFLFGYFHIINVTLMILLVNLKFFKH